MLGNRALPHAWPVPRNRRRDVCTSISHLCLQTFWRKKNKQPQAINKCNHMVVWVHLAHSCTYTCSGHGRPAFLASKTPQIHGSQCKHGNRHPSQLANNRDTFSGRSPNSSLTATSNTTSPGAASSAEASARSPAQPAWPDKLDCTGRWLLHHPWETPRSPQSVLLSPERAKRTLLHLCVFPRQLLFQLHFSSVARQKQGRRKRAFFRPDSFSVHSYSDGGLQPCFSRASVSLLHNQDHPTVVKHTLSPSHWLLGELQPQAAHHHHLHQLMKSPLLLLCQHCS